MLRRKKSSAKNIQKFIRCLYESRIFGKTRKIRHFLKIEKIFKEEKMCNNEQ